MLMTALDDSPLNKIGLHESMLMQISESVESLVKKGIHVSYKRRKYTGETWQAVTWIKADINNGTNNYHSNEGKKHH